jgi:AraC-like DNA-binding protein
MVTEKASTGRGAVVEEVRVLPTGLIGWEAMAARTARRFDRHTHDCFGIGLVLDGAQSSISGRGLVEASAGDLITVNPGEVHDGVPFGGRARSWRMLYLPVDAVQEVAADARGEEGSDSTYEFESPVLNRFECAVAFSALAASVRPEADYFDRLTRDSALSILVDALVRARVAGGSRLLGSAGRAKEYIDDDPLGTPTLSDLAALCGLSRFQLLRAFKRDLGIAPKAYIIQRRLELARQALRRGEPPAQAALSAGFADQSHLNRHFTRRFGYTPGVYATAIRDQ